MYCSFHNDAIDILILNKWWYFFFVSFIEDIFIYQFIYVLMANRLMMS